MSAERNSDTENASWPLNTRSAFQLVSRCGFSVFTHWKQLVGHLGVSLDERNRLERKAVETQDFNTALEEGLDIWLRQCLDASWDKLLEGVDQFELTTADRMRRELHIKPKRPPSDASDPYIAYQVEQAGAILQCNIDTLCSVIRDPGPIACQLFERKVIDSSVYQAAISPYILQLTSGGISTKTLQLLNAIYQTAVERCRVDVIGVLISVLEEIDQVKPLAVSMRTELDEVLLGTTTERTRGSPLANEVEIDIHLEKTAQEKFELLKIRFGGILQKLSKSLSSKSISVNDLKDLLILSFCDLQSAITPCTSIVSLMVELRKSNYCSFANCHLVDFLVSEFQLYDVKKELDAFYSERAVYYETIMLADFVQEAQESIGQNRKVIFRLDWEKNKTSFAEFEHMLKDVFKNASKYIRLKLVRDGSVILICECPAFVVGSLTMLIKENRSVLDKYKTLDVTIDGKVVMRKRPKVYSIDESVYDSQDENGGTPKRSRTRSSTSSGDLLCVEVLPDHLLSPISIEECPLVPPKAIRHFKRTSVPDASSKKLNASSSGSSLEHSLSTPSRSQRSKSDVIPTHQLNRLSSRAFSLGSELDGPVEIIRVSPTAKKHSYPLLLTGDTSRFLSDEEPSVMADGKRNTDSTYSVGKSDSLMKYPWYWGNSSREDIRKKLLDEPDGTFFIWKTASSTPHLHKFMYIVSFRHLGNTKDLRIQFRNGRYSIERERSGLTFESLPSLVNHYTTSPFSISNGKHLVKLEYPAMKYIDVVDGDTSQQELLSVKQLLERLQEVSMMFDNTNAKYEKKQMQKTETKQKLDKVNSTLAGFRSTLDLLKESLTTLELNYTVSKDARHSLNSMTSSYNSIQGKIKDTSQQVSSVVTDQYAAQTQHKELETACNTLQANLTSLLQEKEFLISLLIHEGLSMEEIDELLVKTNHLYSDSENTYVTFYKKQSDVEESFAYDSIMLGSSRHEGIVHHERRLYNYIEWTPPPSRHEQKKPDSYAKLIDDLHPKRTHSVENIHLSSKSPPLSDQTASHLGLDSELTVSLDSSHLKRMSPLNSPSANGGSNPLLRQFTSHHSFESGLRGARSVENLSPVTPPTQSRSASVSTAIEKSTHQKAAGWTPSTWFLDVDGKTANSMLAKKPNGTFLCRPASGEPHKGGGIHIYTLHVVIKKQVTRLKVIEHNDMFGFALPCIFNSPYDLIVHHSKVSLKVYDPSLCSTLDYPINRPQSVI